MVSKRMALIYGKAAAVVFVLCFAVVQLASVRKRTPDGQEPLPKNPIQVVSAADKLVDHVPVPVSDKDRESVISEKRSALHFEQKVGVQHLDSDGANKSPEEHIVKEEVHLLGLGDVGPKINKQNQIQNPNQVDDFEGAAGLGDLHIEEPKEKVDIQKHVVHEEDEEEEEEKEVEDDEFPAHNLKDIKKMQFKEMELPDHMDGVRLEIDGHLNKEYNKEIFLGNHEEFEQHSDIKPETLLEQIFHKVDKNGDHFITLAELEEWIIDKVQEHFDEANEETERIFKHLDTDNRGRITWQHFHIHFLVSKGYDVKTAIKHARDYDGIALEPDEKERLIRYKFRWAEADNNPQDNELNIEEYKAFRHPEQSQAMLDRMVQDILDNLDEDNNGEITEEEFVALPPGELDGAFMDSDRIWQSERRKEFRNVIDMNKDGKVTRLELKNYVDPKNPNHARLEAENLLQLADENKDDQLSLNEVLDNVELFMGSKMVDIGRNFHDEF